MEKKRQRLRDVLAEDKRFTKDELRLLPRSFDIIGEIIIVQIPYALEKKSKIVAETLLKQHKNARAVYARGKFFGRLRKPKLKWLAGKKILETTYRESGCIFKLNIKTCFFSPRLATDRLDIARMCKPKERVIVLFSGIAPYGIVISKNAVVKKVVCVEISKECSKYALENVKLNRLWNTEIIQGDVKRICPILKKKGELFDRIIMGRPQLKETFLKEALMISKKGTIIHFQDFVKEPEIINKVSEKRILDAARKAKRKVKILDIKFLRELAPRKHNIRVDFKVL